MLTFNQAVRRLYLTDRAVKRGQGKLRQASSFPHAVAIGANMVEPTTYMDDRFSRHRTYLLSFRVRLLIEATTDHEHELWFDEAGNAFVSFADKQDAMMFRLALDGDLS